MPFALARTCPPLPLLVRTALLVGVLALLQACSTTGVLSEGDVLPKGERPVQGIERYVANWPTLSVTVTELPAAAIREKCNPFVPARLPRANAWGCAAIQLSRGTCEIFIQHKAPRWVWEHEHAHCRGGDHDGALQAAYDRWAAAGKPRSEP